MATKLWQCDECRSIHSKKKQANDCCETIRIFDKQEDDYEPNSDNDGEWKTSYMNTDSMA